MTELLASRSHSASADLMHSEGDGGCDVVVSGNYASRGVAKIRKTTISRPMHIDRSLSDFDAVSDAHQKSNLRHRCDAG